MVKELNDERKRIINEQAQILSDTYQKMEDSVNRAIKDSESSGAGDVSLLKVFKAAVKLKWEKSLKMESKDRLELAKMEFEARRDAFNEIKDVLRTGREIFLKEIEEQMETSRRAIAEIDEQLKGTADESEQEELIRRKQQHTDRSHESPNTQ